MEVSAELTADKAPVRFGMQAELDNTFHLMRWLGKGPNDTYWGREKVD